MKFFKKCGIQNMFLNKKILGCFLIISSLVVSSSNYIFALKDPLISQEEVMQISREVNRVLTLLSDEKRGEIAETVGIINFELSKRLGTKELVDKICELAEFTVRYLTPIAGQEVADRAVANLGKCFSTVVKLRALKNYPQDIIKLQKIGIDFRKFSSDTSVRRDSVAPVATSLLSSGDLDSYIPGMHVTIDGTECLVGFNDFAVPIMKRLQKQLSDDISHLEGDESVKRFCKDQLEEKARQSIPCGEGFELKPKKYREITDMHDKWECFVPFWQLKVIYDHKQAVKKADKSIEIFSPIISQANFSATSIANLKYYIDRFGGEITSGRPLCLFMVDRKMESGIHAMELPPSNQFSMIESICHRIMHSDMPSDEKVVALHAGLSHLEKALKPHTGDYADKLSFSFAINRVNHYLEMLENYRQGKTLDEILAMRSLRLALNRYAIEYKFMFVSQTEPLLGIRISRCKIIMDNASYIIIFLERMDAEEFKGKIEHALDNKAQNIVQKYPDTPFSREEIREIAESLDPASYQDIIDKLKRKENALSADIERKRIEAEEHFSKATLGRVNLAGNALKYVADGVDWGIDKVKDFIQIKASLATMGGMGTGGTLPQFENPFEPSNLKSTTSQTTTVTPNSVSNTTTTTTQPALHPLGHRFPELKLSPEHIEDFAKGCQAIVDANEILENRKIISTQRGYWEKVQWYEQDFINLLKLNIQLKRAKLEEMDYDGIMIEEKKSVYDNGLTDARLAKFNEYTVEKIDELEERS